MTLELIKITHITSVHPRNDVRIFLKECRSLAEHPEYDVSLVVADGKGHEVCNGIKIYDVGASGGRISRMMKTTRKVYARALELDSDIYHFHDPELLKWGLKLISKGKKVIYDSHEDVSADIIDKEYIPKFARKFIAGWFEKKEKKGAAKLTAIVAATPFIRDRFLPFNKESVDINNFPLQSEYEQQVHPNVERDRSVCYIGGLTRVRCIDKIVQSVAPIQDVSLLMAGRFESEDFRNSITQLKGWEKVKDLGFINRDQANEVKRKCVAGLVIFSPIANHVNAQPNKLFEYMSAGLPIIGSNFPLWKEMIEGNSCGICVDPGSVEEITAAIDKLLNNPDLVTEYGNNGVRLVREKYNWEIEKRKLLALYQRI